MYKFKVKELREKMGYSQNQVARMLEMTEASYRSIEKNRIVNVYTKTLFKLKEVFQVEKIEDLFDLSQKIDD